MKLTTGYMLYVNDKPTRVGRTLEEAQQLAAEHKEGKADLRIESYVAPAQSQIWIYDNDLGSWVEQK